MTIRNCNGDISAYGFACGYAQTLSGRDYYSHGGNDVRIIGESCGYLIEIRITDGPGWLITHDKYGACIKHDDGTGVLVPAGIAWAETLQDARRLFKRACVIARAARDMAE